MNTQHTPGPWRVATTPDSPREKAVRLTRFHSIGVNGGPAIAILPDGQRDILDANARLIAVAPELLAALRELLKHRAPMFSSDEPQATNYQNAVNRARAAIAKAEGSA